MNDLIDWCDEITNNGKDWNEVQVGHVSRGFGRSDLGNDGQVWPTTLKCWNLGSWHCVQSRYLVALQNDTLIVHGSIYLSIAEFTDASPLIGRLIGRIAVRLDTA